jgi:alanine racemase
MLYRDSYIKININNLIFNINRLQEVSSKKLIAVIKANAYGCGDIEIAKILKDNNIDYLAVSSLDEAMNLRNNNVLTNCLVLGFVNQQYVDLCIKNNITITAISLEYVKVLCKQGIAGLRVHLMVDTGMHRVGLQNLEEVNQALLLLKSSGSIIEGIYTHFSCSDDHTNRTSDNQYTKFETILSNLNHKFDYIHTSNTDATVHYKDSISNYVRCGLGMYGIAEYDVGLKPVVSLISRVINVNKVKKGDSVGYGATYTCKEDSWIITIPIGYADGWIRKNQGRKAYINNEFAEFVGRICMDQCMLKVNNPPQILDEVELFGNQITLNKVADDLDTIPYEILTILSDRITKIYYKDNEEVYERTPRFK